MRQFLRGMTISLKSLYKQWNLSQKKMKYLLNVKLHLALCCMPVLLKDYEPPCSLLRAATQGQHFPPSVLKNPCANSLDFSSSFSFQPGEARFQLVGACCTAHVPSTACPLLLPGFLLRPSGGVQPRTRITSQQCSVCCSASKQPEGGEVGLLSGPALLRCQKGFLFALPRK